MTFQRNCSASFRRGGRTIFSLEKVVFTTSLTDVQKKKKFYVAESKGKTGWSLVLRSSIHVVVKKKCALIINIKQDPRTKVEVKQYDRPTQRQRRPAQESADVLRWLFYVFEKSRPQGLKSQGPCSAAQFVNLEPICEEFESGGR